MNLNDLYIDNFGVEPEAVCHANGRVNLIGEHIDYNGGVVLPAQIGRLVGIAMGRGEEGVDKIFSETFGECSIREIGAKADKSWSDYIAGALAIARESGMLDSGVHVAVKSDIPYGSGVSSSAAVIIATLRAVQQLKGDDYDPVEVAKLAQLVEHKFIGMPCGIMDQMAVAVAEPGYALALNTQTLAYSQVKLPDDYHFAVMFSGVSRRLDEGRYAIRREECEQASAALGVADICTMSPSKVLQIDSLKEPLGLRARHVYTEHQRVLQTIDALKQNDMDAVGRLMNFSHDSMRDDFQITTPEVDSVVKSAIEFGAIGARMTGGGFGGCIVACVPKAELDGWAVKVQERHANAKFIC